jgi:poly(3-hydroxybutyrate) depolymerase
MMQTTGLEPLVDREGLVAVYPNGIATQWNDGRAAAAVWGPHDDVEGRASRRDGGSVLNDDE